jgi:hypothetical protein|tara:strand:- start:605 stop:781 length:177 start_codon:yes stop_codon:yes gene_type:complete
MSNYTKRIEGAEQFVYLIQHFENPPHKALSIMIEHNQDLEQVKKYLLAMVNEINEVTK